MQRIESATMGTPNAATEEQGIIATTTTTKAITAEVTAEVIDVSTFPPSGSQKPSGQASFKSKQRKKARKDAQLRNGAQVKVIWIKLHHALQDNAQKEGTKQNGNDCNFFGTIISGSRKQEYNIHFNDLLEGSQEVNVMQRNMQKVVQAEKEEAEFDHATDLAEAYANVTHLITWNDPLKAFADAFSAISKRKQVMELNWEFWKIQYSRLIRIGSLTQ